MPKKEGQVEFVNESTGEKTNVAVMDFNDPSLKDAFAGKPGASLPDNTTIVSPYGNARVDLGTMGLSNDEAPGGGAVGAATGDDRNAGGTRTRAGS